MAVSTISTASLQAPGWQLESADIQSQATVNAVRYSTTDGCVGTQGISETEPLGTTQNAVRVAGIHGPEPPGLLLSGPAWTPLGWPGKGVTWSLDLASGIVGHTLETGGGVVSTRRWAVAGQPGTQMYYAPLGEMAEVPAVTPPAVILRGSDGTTSVTAIADRLENGHLLRAAATATGGSPNQVIREATAAARRQVEADVASLLTRQRDRWAERWSLATVDIDGDSAAELRTRFALFHLLALGDHGDELPVGARGLTGEGYGGHVFWDADCFVLPSLASLAPGAARAMIEYRLRPLDKAKEFARATGFKGARFPWESAAGGGDVTPRWGTNAAGERVPIKTGQQELHIGSDIAWAISTYRRWCGDDAVTSEGGAELIAEVARYWASRVEVDGAGRGHVTGVIGPDEYHETVDDNAYTNRMAAWTLREAGRLVMDHPSLSNPDERRHWSTIAAAMEFGYDADLGRHQQFVGFDQLDPILAASIAPPPFPADLLLGAETVRGSQLIKQADVLMMHQLIPDDLPAGSLEGDLAYYLPRTTHGSSLSPAVHAAVLARAGRPDEALRWYHIALALDLDDLTQTTSGGLHYANIGGIWQALLGGFLSARPVAGGLMVDPNLPQQWTRLRVGFLYRGATVEVEAGHDRTVVKSDRAIPLVVTGGPGLGTATRFELFKDGDGSRWRTR